ncbi:MAG: tyrosine-type recombinase/integrase [Campylobacteraceae bacterium]|nr:tyrosine-type recombinase/integrase [Campylobacteraceae bacterium]
MARITKPLSEAEIKNAKVSEKDYKLYDGSGLYLKVFSNGIKRWYLRYVYEKKTNTLSFGKYPLLTLKEAREKRNDTLKGLSNNINPSSRAKNKNIRKDEHKFIDVAREYFMMREDLNERYKGDCIRKLEKDIYPYVGEEYMDDIESLRMVEVLQIIDKRGANVSAKRTFNIVERIYRYASTVGKAKRNIMGDVDRNLIFRKVEVKNFAHTTDIKELSAVLHAIDYYGGDYSTKMALKILPHLFVRPYNLRYMEWNEINFIDKLWTIPGTKMKTKKDHIVPLSSSVLGVIEEMKKVSKDVSKYVFPSRVSNSKTLSENTLNFSLKRMGFDLTAHGFRHTASTLLHENNRIHKIKSDIIEMQLAHKVGSTVHQIYNKAIYLDERIDLMNWWSSFLDNLKKD